MSEMICDRCQHSSTIFKFFTDSRELVCRACQHIEEEHGPAVSPTTLRALGVLFRLKTQRTPAAWLREQAKALIAHDRILRGEAHG